MNSCSQYENLPQALLTAPPEKSFVTVWNAENDVHTVTFGEFKAWVNAHATHFSEHELRLGDVIVLIMPQGVQLMAAFVGAMLIGAVPAILAYPNFKVEPTKYRFGLAGVSKNLAARALVVDADFRPDLLSHILLPGNTQILHGVPVKNARAPEIDLAHCKGSQIAFIQHSAGTTGLQKGVALSHATVLRHLDRLAAVLHLNQSDRVYSWLPLYHDMGLIACFMLPLVCHLPLVMQSPTNWVIRPASMLELISQYRCTLAWVPNFALQFLARRLRKEDVAPLDLGSLRALINCAEPVRSSSMEEFLSAFSGCKLQPNVLQSSYAMAETVFAATQSPCDGIGGPRCIFIDKNALRQRQRAVVVPSGKPGATSVMSSGRCLPGVEIRVIGPTGATLQEGCVGELLIHSEAMLDGYYNRPDLTKKALRGGWYCSGDLGFLLNGEVYVVGRKKDLIIVAGENIHPQDVEEIVSNHPAIHDGRVVAFGWYNPDVGTEEILIVAELNHEIELQRSTEIERELRNSIVGELGVTAGRVYLKPPKWIVKSTAGKPARSITREKLLAEHPEIRPEDYA
jgi:acyl-CoA synthetase (AMP-forming)/AMP-acid ligase II